MANFVLNCFLIFVFCATSATAGYRRFQFKPQQHFGFDSSSSSSSSSSEWYEAEKFKLVGTKFDYRYLTICLNEENNKLEPIEGQKCANENAKVATGRYRNAVNETGWGILEVETFDNFEPEVQAYAAGVVEGILTKLQIYYHYRNTIEDMCKGQHDYCQRLYRYLVKNLDWIRSQVLEKPKTDIYWRQVNLTFTQLTGIFHGYSKQEYIPVVNYYVTPILMLQLSGELFDLGKFLKRKEMKTDDPDPGHCSGLVKVADGNKDLLMSHVSMSGYNTMNRVLKLYKFAYDKNEIPGHSYSFSSYAGVLVSSDDYTLTSAGLLSIETTISVFNNSLFSSEYIKPESQLHCWVRAIVSNQLARTGKEWVNIFALYNSGTYNNQWTIVDYKLFQPGKELPTSDLIWIIEQIPGYTESEDITWFLRKYRYWPSYNIPYLKSISQISGFEAEGLKMNWYRWGLCPRARIFHRDHHLVQDLQSLYKLMRYNDYQHDEFSQCNCNPPYTAEAAISTRGDLNPANGTYEIPGMGHRNHGSLDYKGTNYELFKKLQIHAVGGPTYDPLPVFDWSKTDIVTNHYGQPTVWKFEPFITEWDAELDVNMLPVKSKKMGDSEEFIESESSSSEGEFF